MSFFKNLLGSLKSMTVLSQIIAVVQVVVQAIEESENALGKLKQGQVPDYNFIAGLAYKKLDIGNFKMYTTETEFKKALTSVTIAIFDLRECFKKNILR